MSLTSSQIIIQFEKLKKKYHNTPEFKNFVKKYRKDIEFIRFKKKHGLRYSQKQANGINHFPQ